MLKLYENHIYQDFSINCYQSLIGDDALPGFLTKIERRGVKNCQNVCCKRIPAA